jgi:NAD(P)-dependent dehydrogenase (short-subunit alcohol dehydrogenase family)
VTGLLEKKVAVITGTGDGMGRAAALRFAAEGALVVGCDVNVNAAEETLRLVTAAGGTMECLFPLDLTDESAANRLMAHAASRFGGIDILYSNAMAMKLGTLSDTRLEDWQFTLANTLTSGWLAAKHAIPHLRRRGGGSIVFISSTAGENVGTGFAGNSPALAPYAVAKAGLTRLGHLLAIELARDRIRVNVVSPAWIDVPATSRVYGSQGSETHRLITRQMLASRLGQPDEVVETALFLVSDRAPFIVGANIRVDGGLITSGAQGAPDPDAGRAFGPAIADWLSVDDQWPDTTRRIPASATVPTQVDP